MRVGSRRVFCIFMSCIRFDTHFPLFDTYGKHFDTHTEAARGANGYHEGTRMANVCPSIGAIAHWSNCLLEQLLVRADRHRTAPYRLVPCALRPLALWLLRYQTHH